MEVVIGQKTIKQVVFVGPYGVGKTTAVRAVSATPVVATEVTSSVVGQLGNNEVRKQTTTVGLDFGEWRAPSGENIAVLGTPGQARFSRVRQTILPRSTAIVLWLFGNQDPVSEARSWLELIAEEAIWSKLTIALTRLPEHEAESVVHRVREFTDLVSPGLPVLAADPRDPEQVAEVLRTALGIPTYVPKRSL